MDERHHILQLIAEAERASGLVVPAPSPQTARQSLIHEPAIGQNVDGRVGCLDVHRTESVLPVLPNSFERGARLNGSPEAMHQMAGVSGVSPHPYPENDFALLSAGEVEGNLDGSAWVQSGP